MSIHNLELIAQHEIANRWHSRLDLLALFGAIAIVLAALITAI